MKFLIVPILLAAVLPAAEAQVVPALNAFATESYQYLARGDENLIFSPFNVATALSMALVGARARTAEEIQTVLHLRYDPNYNVALGTLLSDLTKANNKGGNELLTANGLWLQMGFAIEPSFERTLASDYRAPLTLVDFIADSETARSRINEWTEEHTKQKIKNLLPAGSLDSRTRLVLTSAIYFYGKWQDPFVTSRTQPAVFTLPTGATTKTNFMNQTSHFGYTETSAAQILEMRYTGTGIAFDVLLPRSVSGFPDLEKSLTKENLRGWFGNLSTRNVQVALPKFHAESEFSLARALSIMGMSTAFSNKADFSGISSGRGLSLAQVVHKAFVDVSEQGTEAAAATGVSVSAAAVHAPEPLVIFRADHPFMFLIRDTRTGAILFIGRLTNPR